MHILAFTYTISCFFGLGEAGYAFDLNLIQPQNLMRWQPGTHGPFDTRTARSELVRDVLSLFGPGPVLDRLVLVRGSMVTTIRQIFSGLYLESSTRPKILLVRIGPGWYESIRITQMTNLIRVNPSIRNYGPADLGPGIRTGLTWGQNKIGPEFWTNFSVL